jgi:hypothetical protein
MPRLLATSGAALAVITGLALAPHSHLHPAGTTAGHHPAQADPSSTPVKHAHFAPHDSHHADPVEPFGKDPDDDHRRDGPTGQILPANDFLFQAADTPRDSAPAARVRAVAIVPDVTRGTAIGIPLPPAHGPPVRRPGPARAPPITPPAAA